MPQIFQVLRCYKCLVFQVHQTKKSNKWQCKLCGEKQSIKRHYGLGNGKECRLHVQKLNALRGQTEENIHVVSSDENDNFEDCDEEKNYKQGGNKSKWSTYVEETEQILQAENNHAYLENGKVSFELHRKRKKGNFMRKELCKENVEYKNFENTVHDTVKENNYPEQEKDFTKILLNNSNINFTIGNNKNKNLFSNKEKNKQESIQKTTRWDKFVDNEDNLRDEEGSRIVKNNTLNDPHKIFECCDDSELDIALSII